MNLRRSIGVAAGAATAVALGIALVGRPAAAAGPAAGTPGLHLTACRLPGLEHDALCGVLPRPLDPSRPGGPTIQLHVTVLPALARQKLPDPVLFFAGGPGQGAIGLAGTVDRLLNRLGARRDVVLIDQRGTGHSAPLQCDTPSPEDGLARALDRSRLIEALDACRAQLQRLPWGDLRFYTTSIAMADADAVREALGAPSVDLVGISYGTRAALEYLRQFPDRVRRVVIDGVAPPDMALPESFDIDGRAALEALFRDCTADAACARTHPALRERWLELLASMPRHVDAADPLSGRTLHLDMQADAVTDLVRPALYSPALGALLPHAIESAADGNFDVLLALGSALGGSSPTDLAEGMHFSVVCAEDMPRLAAPSAQGGSLAMYGGVCAHWPRGTVPAAFYTIPRSPAPVLLLSGGLDPVTPPRHAARVAAALGPKARSVVVANSGHGVSSLPCMRDVLFRFVDARTDDEALALDTGCAAAVPRPPAFAPPLPQRAASAPNTQDGFGDDPRPAPPSPRPGPPPDPAPGHPGAPPPTPEPAR